MCEAPYSRPFYNQFIPLSSWSSELYCLSLWPCQLLVALLFLFLLLCTLFSQDSRFFSAICSVILSLIIDVSSFHIKGKHVIGRMLDGMLPFAGSFGISTALSLVSQDGTFVLCTASFNWCAALPFKVDPVPLHPIWSSGFP